MALAILDENLVFRHRLTKIYRNIFPSSAKAMGLGQRKMNFSFH